MATGLGKSHMGTDSFRTQALTSLVPRPSPAPVLITCSTQTGGGNETWLIECGLEGTEGLHNSSLEKSLVEDIS